MRFAINKSNELTNEVAKDEYFFNVSSSENILELSNKFNFFIYRNPPVLGFVESIENNDNNLSITLLFTDVDKRKWHFRFLKGEE